MKKIVLSIIIGILLISMFSFAIAQQNQQQTGQNDDDVEENGAAVTKNKTTREKISFVPWQKRNESECLEGCKCVGAVVSCPTENGKNITITAGRSGNIISMTIERDEEEKEACIKLCKNDECKEKCKEIEAETELELEQEREQNKTRLRARLSNGRNAEIKIMPNTAAERALERLRLKVCNPETCIIELKEKGKGEQAQLAYEVQIERHSRILGIFQAKMRVRAEVDAENGELIRVKKPWWAFMAIEPAET